MAARRPKIINRSNDQYRHGQRYRKIRSLIRCIAFLPLFCLLLERSFFFPFEDGNLSAYFDVERVETIQQKKKVAPIAVLPWTSLKSATTTTTARESLEMITQPFRVTDTSSVYCPVKGTKSILGYHHLGGVTITEAEIKNIPAASRRQWKIPKIMHQQGKSRCVPSALYDLNQQWKQQLLTLSGEDGDDDEDEWSVYFHTEDAMTRLFRAIIAVPDEDVVVQHHHSYVSIGNEFPHLGQILRNCVDNGSFVKRLLWRFLCLYVYGGMYVDLEYAPPPPPQPNKLLNDSISSTIIRDDDDAVLFLDSVSDRSKNKNNNNNNYTIGINPNIMAVSPGHPLMFYAVQQTLLKITTDDSLVVEKDDDDDNDDKTSQNHVVSNILERAFTDFLKSKRLHNKYSSSNSRRTTYSGTDNKTVTIIGSIGTAADVDFQTLLLVKRQSASSDQPSIFNGKESLGEESRRNHLSSCLHKILIDISTIG